MDNILEEMNINGVSFLGQVLPEKDVNWFLQDLTDYKNKEIEEVGIDNLKKVFALETIQDLGRFKGKYYDLILNKKINRVVNDLLNEKSVIHSFNAIILDGSDKSDMQGHRFHRDMPWFPSCRTSILIMIPLVDYGPENGSTQYVKGTHLFKDMPSLSYLEKFKQSSVGKAGEAFIVDATTWHRSGENISGKPRPMIVLKYTLAPFKQQIDFPVSNLEIKTAPDLVKQRLGWNVRVPYNYIEGQDWNQETRKFKSGQYDMSNTYIK